jgi:hypothetical protein
MEMVVKIIGEERQLGINAVWDLQLVINIVDIRDDNFDLMHLVSEFTLLYLLQHQTRNTMFKGPWQILVSKRLEG